MLSAIIWANLSVYTHMYIYNILGVAPTQDASGKLKVWVKIPDPKHLHNIPGGHSYEGFVNPQCLFSIPPQKKKQHVALVTGRERWIQPSLFGHLEVHISQAKLLSKFTSKTQATWVMLDAQSNRWWSWVFTLPKGNSFWTNQGVFLVLSLLVFLGEYLYVSLLWYIM